MFKLENSAQHHTGLAIVLHGFLSNPLKMDYIRDAIATAKPNTHILVPKLPLTLFSSVDANHIAHQLCTEISAQVEYRRQQNWPQFTEIVFVGHSIGALLARKTYLLACGISEDPLSDSPSAPSANIRQDWTAQVSRLILLAGMNRGWSISYHLSLTRAAWLSIGSAVGHFFLLFHKRLVIFQARRGSPFVTQLRLQWLALMKDCQQNHFHLATTVQLLGSIDDLVAPADNIDLDTGRDFIYLDVPLSGHPDVVVMDNSPAGLGRRKVFTQALTEEEKTLRARQIAPSDPTLPQVLPDVTNVIFVIHGIRDEGYWTQKIARKVIGLGQTPPRIYASETTSYGYFSMLAFLLPHKRLQKVEWLMDQYVEAKTLYPGATFSYIGHSQGTYLLAIAVSEYRACRFDHVALAGSVVPRRFDWLSVIQGTKQITALLNYVATRDWVVAFLPGAFEKLHLQDVGSGGHNGFAQASQTPNGPLYERRYIRGGHGAALAEPNWEDLAYFAVNGTPAIPNPQLEAPHRKWWVVLGGWISPLLWVAVIALISWLGWHVFHFSGNPYVQTIAVFLYGFIIWRILTRL